MDVLLPREITDAKFISSSLAEPSASETAWVTGTTYAVGDKRIVASTHRVYQDTAGRILAQRINGRGRITKRALLP